MSSEAAAAGVILEAHVLFAVSQRHLARRPVALLGDDDLSDAFLSAVAVP